jgi:hypothetical protein
VNRGLPESDIMAYRAPCRAEEQGRPEPGAWVTDCFAAQQEAEAAGGVTIRLILPLHPQHVARANLQSDEAAEAVLHDLSYLKTIGRIPAVFRILAPEKMEKWSGR